MDLNKEPQEQAAIDSVNLQRVVSYLESRITDLNDKYNDESSKIERLVYAGQICEAAGALTMIRMYS